MKHLFLFAFLLLGISKAVDAQTACQWAYIPLGISPYNYSIQNMAIDLNGDIIQVGKITNIADMDPGPGASQTSYTSAGENIFVSKTGVNGSLIWIKYFATQLGTSFDFKGVDINSNNEIIIIGNYYGLVDFDLSPTGVDTLRSHFQTYPDYFVAKYTTTGDLQWAFNIGSSTSNNIEARALTILPNNDIIVIANPSSGVIDVDPSAAIHNSIGNNANIISYSNAGNYNWNNNALMTGTAALNNKSVDCDALGNSYVMSVSYYELTINKFNSIGTRLWSKKIGNFSLGNRVTPNSILVDKSNGDFYVAGTFFSTVDFDPNANIVNRTASSSSFEDPFIAKYDAEMNLIWIKNYAGTALFGKYCLDFSGNDIVVVGQLKGSMDFGNGITLSSTTQFRPLYIKLNTSGITQNGYVLNGPGIYNSIYSTSNQSYVTSGLIGSTTDMDPTSSILNLTPSFANNFYAAYGIVAPPPISTLNLKLFLESYYTGNGLMTPTLFNQGQSLNANITDHITVELRSSTSPNTVEKTSIVPLATNGTTTCVFSPALSGSYYIVIKHRNNIETWSSTPIAIGSTPILYDFTTGASLAYGNNQVEVDTGVWALYSGEINSDGNIDLIDLSLLEASINAFQFGYINTDLNGDANVDLLDMPIMENNINHFIFSNHP